MSDNAPAPPSFEEALAELERLVQELEDGRLGLEESLARYEKGVGLLKFCYGQLQQAEQRILLLTGADDEGRPLVRPFEHSATVKADQAEAKRRKKPEGPEELF